MKGVILGVWSIFSTDMKYDDEEIGNLISFPLFLTCKNPFAMITAHIFVIGLLY